MAGSRRGGRREPLSIWPGFVDAFTTLLLLVMFVLTIFLVVQYALRDTITTQIGELDGLSLQVSDLANALGMERQETSRLTSELDTAGMQLAGEQARSAQQATLIATLNATLTSQQTTLTENTARISSFEAQVASLLAERNDARAEGAVLTASVADLEAAQTRLITDQQALNLALAKARTEVDAAAEAARLAAAQREAVDAMVAELRQTVAGRDASLAEMLARLQGAEQESATLATDLGAVQADLSAAEKARLEEQAAAAALRQRLAGVVADLSAEEVAKLAEQAAAEALREKLRSSASELTAMTLALEDQRKRAEDTLTLLAAADLARQDLDVKLAAALLAKERADSNTMDAAALAAERDAVTQQLAEALAAKLAAKLAAERTAADTMTEAEQRLALLATAQAQLSTVQAQSAEDARKMAVLNEQLAALRGQLGSLQATLDDTAARDSTARVQIENLGGQLNSALATVAAEQRRRAELEAAERARLEAEATDLASYRSEFFGKLRLLLAGREGVQIVGDRFVFSSEVLFEPGSADLAPAGQAQIASVVGTLQEIIGQIPPEIDWMIRVDGHTDNVPQAGGGKYTSNWELSQGRALSVVLYMVDQLGFPQDRVAATGFGEYRPVALGDSPAARAQNRRIELKLTER